ncbi:hypothetical protein UPYG_G00281910 [Umbra pygmaea]|uniref:HAUS augmin-like complex subunit 4 n=1 Tax=Umbra pygmaea TaxID=75934 RepID=A0ABD0WIZ5_UMBPY
MSTHNDSSSVPSSSSSLAKGDSLHQQVLASFPLCQLTEEDLTQNPLFCKLLATLSQHVDHTGLTVTQKRALEKAERDLQTQRLSWLRSESLYRLLQEMIQEHCVRKHHSTVSPEDDMFYETVEQCLIVAQCVRQLDCSATTNQDQPPVLGLTAQQVLELMPPEQDVCKMKERLHRELENHLKKKCFTLLSYYQPEWEDESEGLKNMKLSCLSGLLESQKKRAESLKEKSHDSATLLQRHTYCYLSELLGCIHILQSLILDHRLKAQKELDGKKIDYFEAKCEIVMQKIRAEMLEIQLDTYTADTISAHRKIRETLETELNASQLEKQSVVSKLSSFEIFGKEFEALAEEYSRLRREIDTKSWALKEFSQHTD